jgi:hypothetical protein
MRQRYDWPCQYLHICQAALPGQPSCGHRIVGGRTGSRTDAPKFPTLLDELRALEKIINAA